MEKSEVRFFKILPFINIVLSFLIVIHHSFNINIDYNVNIKNVAWIIERYLYNITECAVPIFFFMSAVLFYRDFHGELETFKRKVKNRVKSLLLPYIIFNIIGYIKHIVFANQDFGLFRLLGSIITSDTMPLWFLRELFILSILAPILYKLKSKRNVEYFVNFFIIILIITGIVKYRTFVYWLPLYLYGSNHNIYDLINERKNKYLSIIIVFMFFMMPLFLPNINGNMDMLGNIVFYFYRFISVQFYLCLINKLSKYNVKQHYFYKYSFWVYCTHFPFISIYKLFFSKIISLFNIDINNVVLLFQYVSTICIVCIVCIVSANIVKKLFPKMFLILNGGRC